MNPYIVGTIVGLCGGGIEFLLIEFDKIDMSNSAPKLSPGVQRSRIEWIIAHSLIGAVAGFISTVGFTSADGTILLAMPQQLMFNFLAGLTGPAFIAALKNRFKKNMGCHHQIRSYQRVSKKTILMTNKPNKALQPTPNGVAELER